MIDFKTILGLAVVLAAGPSARAADPAFATKPTVTRSGDRVTIRFAVENACDVTVAVEDARGRIVRHLASGMLGANAPAPLQKKSLSQTLVWDGKDDAGRYVIARDDCSLRVSLGLKMQYERTLFWSPKKRASHRRTTGPVFQAAPEGVYVFDGGDAIDHVRLFSHEGEYLRTVYPFPAGKLSDLPGMLWHTFASDGTKSPIKPNFLQCTFLTSGTNCFTICYTGGRYKTHESKSVAHFGQFGRATEDLAVAGGRLATASFRLNRFAGNGGAVRVGPKRLGLYGPRVDIRSKDKRGFYKATASTQAVMRGGYGRVMNLRPHRLALSPDGKTLYLTRYIENFSHDMYAHNYWQHGVYRMDYEGDDEPELFLGGVKSGSDDRHFNMPTDVACDSAGRVYVADFYNNRVQIFTPGGKLTGSIPVEHPAQLAVSPKTGEVWIFSWQVLSTSRQKHAEFERPFALRQFKSADDPKLLATYDLPMTDTLSRREHYGDVDFWADPPVVWLSVSGSAGRSKRSYEYTSANTVLLAVEGKALKPVRRFTDEVRKAVVRRRPPDWQRQRLYFDHKNERLYVGEGDSGNGKSFRDAVVIDPNTGATKIVKLPFDAEDMCFGINGLAYLRTAKAVARYDAATWREVPWDYGEQRPKMTYNVHSDRREAKVASAIALPTNMAWHHGGVHVSPKGELAVGCLYWFRPKELPRFTRVQTVLPAGKPYQPRIYPGRLTNACYGSEYVHVWDRHGKLIREDAAPGLGIVNGVGIDSAGDIYVLSAAPRIVDGKPHFNDMAGTLMKFSPGKGRIVGDDERRTAVPVGATGKPDGSADLYRSPGKCWVTEAEWMFEGVGWGGKNPGNGCACWNCRFALDFFGRSFAPEMDRYSVAVLDSAGNVVSRVGRCGNVDDGRPLIADGGPPKPRSIGGDELSLFHAPYVATHTDRRLFIADPGNARIVSVKIGYRATQRVGLKNVSDTGARE